MRETAVTALVCRLCGNAPAVGDYLCAACRAKVDRDKLPS